MIIETGKSYRTVDGRLAKITHFEPEQGKFRYVGTLQHFNEPDEENCRWNNEGDRIVSIFDRGTSLLRESGGVILINPGDYNLFLEGKKTATSRYGDRRKGFVPGSIMDFARNDDQREYTRIRILKTEVCCLHELTEKDAKAIGDYSRTEAIIDFTSVYTKLNRDVHSNTVITIVHFEVAI